MDRCVDALCSMAAWQGGCPCGPPEEALLGLQAAHDEETGQEADAGGTSGGRGLGEMRGDGCEVSMTEKRREDRGGDAKCEYQYARV